MARNDDDDSSLPPIGEDTGKFLDEVKKGKPRNFLLICKGSQVKYLKLKKKGIKAAEIVEAKKLGYKGDAYIGVVTGMGMNLVFHLAISDGYESEPCKNTFLKDFLDEKAGFKCKPTFSIDPTPPDIPFEEEDLQHPLIQRFMKMAEQIATVLDARPEAASELTKSAKGIRVLLQEGSFDEAEPLITQFGARLQELLQGEGTTQVSSTSEPPVAPTPTPSTPVTPPGDDGMKAKLQEALNKLVPQIKQIVTAQPERKVELLTPIAAIKQQLDVNDLQSARQGILEMGAKLKGLLAGEASKPLAGATANDDAKVEYERKYSVLEPKYQNAISMQLGDTSKFQAVMAYAREQAGAGVFVNAIKALDRLEKALDAAIAEGSKETDVIPQNIIADRARFLKIRWQQALAAIRSEVDKIRAAVGESFAEEDGNKLADAFQKYIDQFFDHFNDAIFSAEKADEENLKPIEAARDAIDTFRSKVGGDVVIRQLDLAAKELGGSAANIQVISTITQALDELETRLGS